MSVVEKAAIRNVAIGIGQAGRDPMAWTFAVVMTEYETFKRVLPCCEAKEVAAPDGDRRLCVCMSFSIGHTQPHGRFFGVTANHVLYCSFDNLGT